MTEITQELPPPGVEVLVKFSSGMFAVASHHPERSDEKWWPGAATFGEYGYEAIVTQDVVSWRALP